MLTRGRLHRHEERARRGPDDGRHGEEDDIEPLDQLDPRSGEPTEPIAGFAPWIVFSILSSV
jgi:hypothetical protein